MDSAPVLLPSPRKSAFDDAPYTHEIRELSSEEDAYSYDHSPDEAVFDDDDTHAESQDTGSPHTSEDDDDNLSLMPTDNDSRAASTIYTPHKRRSPFRHPSSVRNIQLDTTPPHLVSPGRRQYHLPTATSRSATPQSHYSTLSRPHSSRSSPTKKPKVRKEHPLVLLHLTLLPLTLPYSQSLLETVLPARKLADCKLLKEKLAAPVIRERGVLIPHPKDEYELLEERLLEVLELEQGILTRDGHFLPPGRTELSRAGSPRTTRSRFGTEDIPEEDESVLEHDQQLDEIHDEAALCEDCGRHIETIDSDRRWDIRVYAANGLMREGAWSAAWREMERVDVEIRPFISDEMKRDLEARWEEMELLMSGGTEPPARSPTEELVHQSIEADDAVVNVPVITQEPDEARMRLSTERLKEIYGEEADARLEAFESSPVAKTPEPLLSARAKTFDEIPLSILLQNYVKILLQDRRNAAIACLSLLVLFMAMQVQRPQGLPEIINGASAAVVPAAGAVIDAVPPLNPVVQPVLSVKSDVSSASDRIAAVTEDTKQYVSATMLEPSEPSSDNVADSADGTDRIIFD